MDMTAQTSDGRALLAAFLGQKNKTQAQFAHEVGCSESHLCLVLQGKRGMSFGLAKRVSEAAGIPVEALPHEKEAAQ